MEQQSSRHVMSQEWVLRCIENSRREIILLMKIKGKTGSGVLRCVFRDVRSGDVFRTHDDGE